MSERILDPVADAALIRALRGIDAAYAATAAAGSELRPGLPHRLHPLPAAGPRLRGYPLPPLPGARARPAPLRQRPGRDRLRVVGGPAAVVLAGVAMEQ